MSKELERVKIDQQDANLLRAKVDQLSNDRASLGVLFMDRETLRERFEEQESKYDAEMQTIRASISSQLADIRNISHLLMKKYNIDSSKEGWDLDVYNAVFRRTESTVEACSRVSDSAKSSEVKK